EKRRRDWKTSRWCEWDSCGFQGHTMEELSDHMELGEWPEYACLWSGCDFLSMGSPTELEVHAYFHNYHGKLKFVGSQLLKSRPDLPSCSQALHIHNLIPEGSDGYICQWEHCDCTFNNPEWFYRHVDNHVESAEPQSFSQQQQALFCSWAGCDAFFKIRYRLREHMRSHTQERLVACPTCGSMFSSNTKLFDHLQRQADPVESLVCEHCGKAFPSERLLRDHIRQHVSLLRHELHDAAALKIHIRFRHCDERPYPCDFCDKRFKNQRDLQKHTEVHNEGTVYHCTVEGCDYSCHTFQTMNNHFKRMSKYKCHICDKVFSWCYTLTLHLRKKHELKWPSGHSRFRVDGFLKVNMVRFETVEVTKEIMKNMAKKPQSLRKSPRTSSRARGAASRSGRSSPPAPHLLPGRRRIGSGQPAGWRLAHLLRDEHHSPRRGRRRRAGGPRGRRASGAVQALTEVARGLGMDVV
uniref:Zgc:112083 n=1 Tax=Salarias fasciatus TaxID=181472 RepID=A0A672FVN5_SALFA